MEYQKGDYIIPTNKNKLQLNVIHKYLSEEAYWCKNIPFETVKKSIENSFCFGIFYKEKQIGFARVITDYATFAYLADVFILKSHRGKGLSKWLMQIIMQCPDLQGLRRWMLITGDAHGLYEKHAGFKLIGNPERFMEKRLIEKY